MNVRQFLQWLHTASAGDRADATSALARCYLHSELSSDDLAAAEGAMIMLLDDPSPLVRRALSEVFAVSEKAPAVIVRALAAEQPDIAVPVLSRSPLLLDADLVDLVATGHPQAQSAIAARRPLSCAVAAAIAEVGAEHACLAMLENACADITAASMNRVVERFGHVAPVRERLLARDDLPAAIRQTLLSKLSLTLAGFVASRQWLADEHARHATREACEKATVALAAETAYHEIGDLVRHLRETGQLTAILILRALLSGNVVLFEEALADLSDLPIDRVISYVHDKNISGFSALYRKAGLPDAAYPAFREALAAMRQSAAIGEQGGAGRLKRGMVERVLMRCSAETDRRMQPVLVLLRRFAVEAAREEARMFCNDLVAGGGTATDEFADTDIANATAIAGRRNGGPLADDDVITSGLSADEGAATSAARGHTWPDNVLAAISAIDEIAAAAVALADRITASETAAVGDPAADHAADDVFPADNIANDAFATAGFIAVDMTTGEIAVENFRPDNLDDDLRLVA